MFALRHACWPLLATLSLITPVSAMEPVYRPQVGTPSIASTSTSLDLLSEQAHFSGSSQRLGQSDFDVNTPVAPGEKGRAPNGHSLLDLSF